MNNELEIVETKKLSLFELLTIRDDNEQWVRVDQLASDLNSCSCFVRFKLSTFVLEQVRDNPPDRWEKRGLESILKLLELIGELNSVWELLLFVLESIPKMHGIKAESFIWMLAFQMLKSDWIWKICGREMDFLLALKRFRDSYSSSLEKISSFTSYISSLAVKHPIFAQPPPPQSTMNLSAPLIPTMGVLGLESQGDTNEIISSYKEKCRADLSDRVDFRSCVADLNVSLNSSHHDFSEVVVYVLEKEFDSNSKLPVWYWTSREFIDWEINGKDLLDCIQSPKSGKFVLSLIETNSLLLFEVFEWLLTRIDTQLKQSLDIFLELEKSIPSNQMLSNSTWDATYKFIKKILQVRSNAIAVANSQPNQQESILSIDEMLADKTILKLMRRWCCEVWDQKDLEAFNALVNLCKSQFHSTSAVPPSYLSLSNRFLFWMVWVESESRESEKSHEPFSNELEFVFYWFAVCPVTNYCLSWRSCLLRAHLESSTNQESYIPFLATIIHSHSLSNPQSQALLIQLLSNLCR